MADLKYKEESESETSERREHIIDIVKDGMNALTAILSFKKIWERDLLSDLPEEINSTANRLF